MRGVSVKSPAFQFYPSDFVGSGKVGTMTAEEVGAYTLLLCLDWNETGFVLDEEELARWCRLSPARFRKAWLRVSRCFVERDGRLYNPRLEAERTKQAEWRAKSAKGGRASGEARAKGGSRVVEAPGQPQANTPSPTPSLTNSVSQSGADVAALLDGLPESSRIAWQAEIEAAAEGMHGKPLTQEQIDRACREYVGNGHLDRPTLRHFRGFLASAGKPPAIRPITPIARPSKQEVGRMHLQQWLNDKQAARAAGGSDGE